jgi:hypothetical protein
VLLIRSGNPEIGLGFGGQHGIQNLFHGHGVRAKSPGVEKIAGTKPLVIFITGGVIVICAVEGYGEVIEVDAFEFLCIAMGFFNLSNQAGLHGAPPVKLKKAPAYAKPGALIFLRENQYFHSRVSPITSQ